MFIFFSSTPLFWSIKLFHFHDLVVFITLEVRPDYSVVHKCRAVLCTCIAVTAEEQKHRLNKYSLNYLSVEGNKLSMLFVGPMHRFWHQLQ